MGSGYDEVAKAIATNVPRRKVLKLLAGGVAASIGSAIVGGSASAQVPSFGSRAGSHTESDNFDLGTIQQEPVINGTQDSFRPTIPWWSAFYPGRQNSFGINGSNPL